MTVLKILVKAVPDTRPVWVGYSNYVVLLNGDQEGPAWETLVDAEIAAFSLVVFWSRRGYASMVTMDVHPD